VTASGANAMPPRRGMRRILLIKLSSAGDIIHALPVLAGLRRRWPEAHIAWMVSTPFAELLDGHPDLDEVIRFDRRRFAHLGRQWSASWAFARFCWRLRARRFDLVVDLQGLFRSGFLSLVSGAPRRLGLSDAREMAGAFYTRRVGRRTPNLHAVDRCYQMATALGFAEQGPRFLLHVPDACRAEVTELLRDSEVEGRPFAVLAIGARWETKRWPAERFARLADALAERHGLASVLVGSEDDRQLAEQVRQYSHSGPVNLAGRTRWGQLMALLEQARMVVSNDSGPMHVAAALGRPLVAVLGPTHPGRTGPYCLPEGVVRRDLPCSPCYLRMLASCAHGHACMRDLPVESVLKAAGRALCGQGQSRLRVAVSGPGEAAGSR
jgi:heptosyltransferase-1